MRMLWAVLLWTGLAGAQAINAPDPAAEAARDDNHILGIVPNYATVNEPSAIYHPLSTRGKFAVAAHDSFDPFNWVIAGVYAGVYQRENDYPQFGQGAQGYAKRYGATFADGAISTYMTEAILPAILHDDPRYFRLGEGRKWKRTGYAITRVLVTRTDAGGSRFNTSEIAGNLLAASLGNLYYPSLNRTAGDTLEKFSINVVSDAGFNVLKEFWPDMRHKVLHR